MTDLPATVQEAFSTGWQMAELFHASVPRHPGRQTAVPPHLSGISGLDHLQTIELHLNQVQKALADLLPPPAAQADVQADVAAINKDLGSTPIDGAVVRADIAQLHTDALCQLTVADFRLGKAYGLGRALAETVLLPSAAPPECRATTSKDKFSPGRLGNLQRWLADLKTVLPDHSSFAVSTSLVAWEHWVTGASDDDLARAGPYLHRQGQQWRALLSGERAAGDLLGTMDLVNAARGMSTKVGRIISSYARHYWRLILLIVALIVVVVGGIVGGAVASGNSKLLWAGLTALVGVLGGWKGVQATLGRGIRAIEPDLWQSELDTAIAMRVLILPPPPPTTTTATATATAKPRAQSPQLEAMEGLLPADTAVGVKKHVDAMAAAATASSNGAAASSNGAAASSNGAAASSNGAAVHSDGAGNVMTQAQTGAQPNHQESR